ncbi:hypothetical protein TNCV_2276641 [Trichonephila clavipes]|nr:hypothetical protein TNCV_2276641 [Trichonephila clavipes]
MLSISAILLLIIVLWRVLPSRKLESLPNPAVLKIRSKKRKVDYEIKDATENLSSEVSTAGDGAALRTTTLLIKRSNDRRNNRNTLIMIRA